MGLGITILVGMWPCMYVDECNVCSVCMFLVWDFGLLFRIADVVKMGLLEVRLAIITVFYFIFSVLSLFVS